MSALLLDTEALIWWDANDRRLGSTARAAIAESDEAYVSAASAWEIVIKSALGNLRTTRRPTKVVEDGGFQELPVTFAFAEAVAELPRHHNDPFARLIIATARLEGLTIVTSDDAFICQCGPL